MASFKIHCKKQTLTFPEGKVMSVKQLLEHFRNGCGFSGGYFYANDVLLHDNEEILISADCFYEVRYGVLKPRYFKLFIRLTNISNDFYFYC
jgi:hypothetical protein